MIFPIPKRDVDQPGDNLLAVSSHDMVLWVGYLSMISGIYFEIFLWIDDDGAATPPRPI